MATVDEHVQAKGDGTKIQGKADFTKDSTKQNAASYQQLFSFASPADVIMMIIGTIGGIATGCSLPIFCILFGRMLDSLNTSGSIKKAVDAVVIDFLIIAAAQLVSSCLQCYCWTVAGERQTQRMRIKYVRSILSQEVGWFDTCGAAELSTRTADLLGKIQDGITRRVGDLVQFLAQFLFAFIAAFYLSWRLTIVLIASFPIIAAAGWFLIRSITSAQNESSEQYAQAGGLATEMLSSIRTVTALNIQPHAIVRYRDFIVNAMNVGIMKGLQVGFGNGLTFCVSFMTYALGFWYGAKLIADAHNRGCWTGAECISGGKVIAVFFSIIVGSTGLGQLMPPMGAFFAAKAAAGPVHEVINRKPAIDGLSDEGDKPSARSDGIIELRDVHFAYPSRPDVQICKGYSLKIEKGEIVAICGASGCGKSTIINLLLRFYDPQSGDVLLDNRNIKGLNVRWLRSQMGYVGQEPVLFAGSILDNIAYGVDKELNPSASDTAALKERVIAAAKLANAHDFIMAFPNQYDTDVGASGSSISGGQKQRIAIARALIKKPAVLLLDEATSALDATSERVVQQAIDELQHSKAQTTLVIAHRLSTIRGADKIAVVSEGVIAELGKHDALVAKNGIYAELVRLQMGGEDMADSVKESIRMRKNMDMDSSDALNSLAAKEQVSVTKKPDNTAGAIDEISTAPDTVGVSKEEQRALKTKMWSLVFPQLHWLIVGLTGAAMVGATFPIWGLLLAKTQNMFYYRDTQRLRDTSVLVAERFIMLGFCSLIGYTLQHYGVAQVGQRICAVLRSDMFASFIRREISFFDDERNAVGTLTTRLADDARIIHEATGETFSNQLQACFTLAVGLIIGFSASWQISLVVIATFPLNIIASAIRMKARTGQQYDDADNSETSSHGGVISTAFVHMRTVCAFSMQHHVAHVYESLTEAISVERQHKSLIGGLSLGLSNCVMFLCYALLFWYGSTLIIANKITFVELMTAMLSLMLGALGLGQALNDVGDQKEGIDAAKRVFVAIDEGETAPIDGLSDLGKKPDQRSEGVIELRNVCFRYPTRPDVEVCKDYSLKVEKGQLVALVGPSGSGKSTIINLLLRFYDPQSGDVLLDGENIKDLNVRWLRSQIGYVGQEPKLFVGSVADNIAKGRRESADARLLTLEEVMRDQSRREWCSGCQGAHVDNAAASNNAYKPITTRRSDVEGGDPELDDIRAAARASHADSFISEFSNKYETDVGEGSVMVSGGQKQRIAIARALIRKPSVLLLDEATSALDAASEKLVQESIDELQQSKTQTTIVIAHRLTTIKNADKIVVIDQGHVIEEGTHAGLLESGGMYAELWVKQLGASPTN